MKKLFIKMSMLILLVLFFTKTVFGQETVKETGEEHFLSVPDEIVLPLQSAALSSDGKTIAVRLTNRIWLYSLSKLKTINFLSFIGGESTGGEITFSPDNKLIACGDQKGLVWIWSISNGKLIESARGFTEEGSGMEYVHSVAFSSDGAFLAVGNAGADVFLWDLPSLKQTHLFNHRSNAMNVRFSPDSSYLGVATGDIEASGTNRMEGRIVIWDWHAHRKLSAFSTGGVLATAIAFSPDGQLVAGGNTDGDIGIWRVHDALPVATFKHHRNRIFDLHFSSQSDLLVSASEDHHAIIWDIQNPGIARKLPHYYRVLSAIISRNNSMVITADMKGINFWRISDGKNMARLIALKGGKFLVFTSDGYFTTDAPDYIQPVRDGTGPASIKLTHHQPDMVLNVLHQSFQ